MKLLQGLEMTSNTTELLRHKKLSASTVHSFLENGFIKINGPIFDDETFQNLKKHLYHILGAETPNLTSCNITDLHFRHPIVLKWLLSDNVLDLMEDLLGPHFAFWTSSIFFKQAHSNEKAYWHKDIYGLDTNTYFSRNDVAALLISLDHSTLESGCVRYIPGTHRQKIRHDALTPENSLFKSLSMIDPKSINTAAAIPIELEENQASVHNINTVHGSEPNRSFSPRLLVSAKFFSTDIYCKFKNFPDIAEPFLVRGKDLSGSQLRSLRLP